MTAAPGRYCFYLRILGFGKLLQAGDGARPAQLAEAALHAHARWNTLHRVFKLAALGDALLLYQDPDGFHQWAFLDLIVLASLLHTTMLAHEIPVRGIIGFGDFKLQQNSEGRQSVVYGLALADVAAAQGREQWLGLAALPHGWSLYAEQEPHAISLHEQQSRWQVREDGLLAINPFRNLMRNWEQDALGNRPLSYASWDAPEFPNELRAFRFINTRAGDYARKGDFSSHIAVKYHATRAWLAHLLPLACYEWAQRVSLLVT